jgi:hypothetical protein
MKEYKYTGRFWSVRMDMQGNIERYFPLEPEPRLLVAEISLNKKLKEEPK